LIFDVIVFISARGANSRQTIVVDAQLTGAESHKKQARRTISCCRRQRFSAANLALGLKMAVKA
jgi:hypothetical protein